MSHAQTWTRGILGGLCGAALLAVLALSGCGGKKGTVAEYYGPLPPPELDQRPPGRGRGFHGHLQDLP